MTTPPDRQSGKIITYYLEMLSPADFREAGESPDLLICESEIKQFRVNQFLYRLIGDYWQWTEKLDWSDEQWQAQVENDNHRTWLALHRGSIAGYYELDRPNGTDTEIYYLGLVPHFIGKGFGGCLLSHAIKSAWAWEGTQRVWVHTCTRDHPTALANYRARGMRLYKVLTTDE